MELNSYQKTAIKDIKTYLSILNADKDIFAAWKDYWGSKDVNVGGGGVPAYNNAISGVPHICMKVPTGGGKTFMACSAVKPIMESMPLGRPQVVVWLVPSNAILTQTIRNLENVNHPYRQRLNRDFGSKVGVYTKDMLLTGHNFTPDTVREMLTVCVLSYDSLRVDSKKKDVRKVYQENGNLYLFAKLFKDDSVLLADTPDTALIQVLRHLSPVVIVDESHNAGSDLSVEMLNNLNPSFVLDLTATPRRNSNIITYVDARELKKEHMVKLPVVVYNRTSRQNVIQDAIQLRGSIERQAVEEGEREGEYIRPIVLFQAQPKTSEDSETFDRVKTMLIDMGIPKEQIAIKTSKVDELDKLDLMSRDCQIRYIITVNALKEGWDCPFAYILASLANKTSTVDVEQIVGRILRQPYAKQHRASLLNTSYVLTCSNEFRATLNSIVLGLNKAGFSRRDCRIGEEQLPFDTPVAPAHQTTMFDSHAVPEPTDLENDNFEDITPSEVRVVIDEGGEPTSAVRSMEEKATLQSKEYEKTLDETKNDGFLGGDLGDMLKQYAIQPQFAEEAETLRVPQFFQRTTPNLFGGEYRLLTPEALSDGFSLNGQDAKISFELATGEMWRVDLEDKGEAVPKYIKASKEQSEYLREYLEKLPPERRIQQCTDMLSRQINRNNRYAASEINGYVKRIVSGMTEDELAAMETSIPVYAAKIQQKIDKLEATYREEQFQKFLDSGKIVCQPSFTLAKVITPSDATDSIPLSLYESEKNDMNDFEFEVINTVVGLGNTKWWHRIIERKDFRLNGFINHYPDFMVMTKSGALVLIETKGDHLANDESRAKLLLGRRWQGQAGTSYRYFMVFKDKELRLDGAYTLDGFVEVMKDL